MATTSIPAEVYPLSTQDGKAIPLDIIKPLGIIQKDFALISESFAVPTGYPVVAISTDKPCFLGFDIDPSTRADGIFLADTLYIPENSTLTVNIPEGITLIYVQAVDEVGTIVIQMMQQWASISLQSQTVRI